MALAVGLLALAALASRCSASACCASTSARSCFRLGRLLPRRGPGLVVLIPARRPDGARRPAHGHADDPAAGGHHARQRPRPGHRRLLLPRRRPGRAVTRDRGVRARHVADRADHAALRARPRRPRPAARRARRLNDDLQKIIDEQTEPWGIKVSTVEIKDVEIPEAMQRAMARQAEAERERRAKIINAEGRVPGRREAARTPPRSSAATRRRCSCATCRRCSRSAASRTPRSSSRCPST